jgi:hypothetical protein
MKVYIGPYTDSDGREVDIQIDNYDHWNADHTIALVALPIIKDLREKSQGAPYVELDDVPASLHPVGTWPPHEPDPAHFDRWDYVLDEIIYALDYIANDREFDAYESEPDSDGLFGTKITEESTKRMEEESKRVKNGLLLFGKYYQALWS